MDHATVEQTLRTDLKKLDTKKKTIEHEADAIFLELTTSPDDGIDPMGIDTPLVDSDGYPRGDIDLYRCRTLRRRFRELRTDHKEISNTIEGLLIELSALKGTQKHEERQSELDERRRPKPKPKYDPITGKWVVMNWDGTMAGIKGGEIRQFADLDRQLSNLTGDDESSLTTNGSSSLPSSRVNSTRSTTYDYEPRPRYATDDEDDEDGGNGGTRKKPFARINAVASSSPAEESGLLEDDLIVSFGSLSAENNDHLRAIPALVLEAAEYQQSIEIKVLRRPQRFRQGTPDEVTTVWDDLTLALKPRPWPGRGLLGCHIVPYSR